MTNLSARDLEPILAVAGKLAAPFNLTTMLAEVVDAAKQVLKADRGTVWLYDREADELVLRFSIDVPPLRIRADTGLVGSCARSRKAINVQDCYSDPRFDASTDRLSGYRTRCMLTLPLIDHQGTLVGVMQLLNKAGGIFDESDEWLAGVLAAQCAVALKRVQMTEALLEGEKMRQELEAARVVQMSSLPSTMPSLPGYDLYGTFRPADLTGGDTFDLARVEQGLLIVLADATGHGIGPALWVTQMQAMLRMAFRMGATLESAFVQVNNQLAEMLPGDRFITAFIGLLDAAAHRLRFHSGGQAPILHFEGATGRCTHYMPTSVPLAVMPLASLRQPAVVLEMRPGDIVALISDGIYEYHNKNGEEFGERGVLRTLRDHHRKPMAELSAALFDAVRTFAAGAPQEDDMTVVLVKREAAGSASGTFKRSFEAIDDIFAFTADAFEREGIEPGIRPTVDLVLEELFTNVVKYGHSGETPLRVELTKVPDGVEVIFTDDDATPFDPTRAPDVDIEAPIEERQPGGLGLHLIRRLVESIEYRYVEESRQGQVRFRIKEKHDARD